MVQESFFQPFNKWAMIVGSFKAPVNSSWEKQGVLNRLELAQGAGILVGSFYKVAKIIIYFANYQSVLESMI